ncbi:hypothetical protein [Gordonia sp. VNK21]|uniref:hypothetical protein n=1 Tax=Gordonia sp. VNK21 TaxID=3382483 RepID=UPI0038D442FC
MQGPRTHPNLDYPSFDPLQNVAVTARAVADLRALVSWVGQQDPLDITIGGTSVVDPLAVMPYAPENRRAVIAALNDRVTWVTAAQKLHEHWGGRIDWYAGGHVGHVFSGQVRAATDQFLSVPPHAVE